MDPIELMKLIALLLCVPTQLWLSQTTAPTNNGRVGERIDWKGGGHGLMVSARYRGQILLGQVSAVKAPCLLQCDMNSEVIDGVKHSRVTLMPRTKT